MKYPIVKVKDESGNEYEAYEAFVGGARILLDKDIAALDADGPEACMDKEVKAAEEAMKACS